MRRLQKVRGRERAEGEKWKKTNGESRFIDCWREEKNGGCSFGEQETELQPSGQGEPCEQPVEIKILQPYCCQSSAHHVMHILFEEQTLLGLRAPQCIQCQETSLLLCKTLSFNPPRSLLLPSAVSPSICLPFSHLTFRHKEFTYKSTSHPFGTH